MERTVIISILSILLSTNVSIGQVITFNKTFDLSNGNYESATGLTEIDDGYLFSQSNYTTSFEHLEATIGKIDYEGNLLWQASFCGNGFSCYQTSNNLRRVDDDLILIVGSVDRRNIEDQIDAMIFSLSPEADSIELISFGGEGVDNCVDIQRVPGGYIACGASGSGESISDFYLVRLNDDLEILWEKFLGGGGYQLGQSVTQTPDGGFLLSGKELEAIGQANIFLVKTDSLGNLEWQKTIGGLGNNDGLHNVVTLSDGSILVTASRNTNFGYMAKILEDGTEVWERTYPGGEEDLLTTKAIELDDGHLVVGGGRRVYNQATQNYVRHARVVKFTPDGDVVWERLFHGRPDIDNYFYGLTSTSDGGFIGYGSSYGPDNSTLQDSWIVKMDSEGNACDSLGCLLVDWVDIRAGNPQLLISPNPATDFAYIDYFLPASYRHIQVAVFDLQGRLVWQHRAEGTASTGSVGLSVAGWASGLYVVRVTGGGQVIASERLVVP